jgi:thiosulfate/3-mercaptopyruvate sulfurtransferase
VFQAFQRIFIFAAVIFSLIIFSSSKLIAFEIKLEKEQAKEKSIRKLSGPIILDPRPAFDYSMEHFAIAEPIRWQDFAQTEKPHQGALDPDSDFLARRLRVFGIMPDREIIILGKGIKGAGEEGRIAWMLKYLGLTRIKIATYDEFKGQRVSGEGPEVDSTPVWNPKVQENLRAKRSDVEKLISEKIQGHYLPGHYLVDTRVESEFKKLAPISPQAINIPWTEFVNTYGGQISVAKVTEILKRHGLQTKTLLPVEIIFYSEDSISSAYATFAASEAGYTVRHYDGGLNEWRSKDAQR